MNLFLVENKRNILFVSRLGMFNDLLLKIVAQKKQCTRISRTVFGYLTDPCEKISLVLSSIRTQEHWLTFLNKNMIVI